MKDLKEYVDNDAPLDKAIRYSVCPFCGKKKDAFVVIPKQKGFLLWCHCCHQKEWLPRGKRSPSQVKKLLVVQQQTSTEIRLPSDFSFNIPMSALSWLFKYGIKEDTIKALGIGYSEKYQRVIIPMYDGETLIYWTGRYTNDYRKDGQPKYISRTKYGSYFWIHNPLGSNKAVIVEDALSAIKVGESGYAAVCIFGSYVGDKSLLKLAELFKHIHIWLDPDKRKYSVSVKRRADMLGLNVDVVLTPTKDPKDFSNVEIKEILHDSSRIEKDVTETRDSSDEGADRI